MSVTYEPWLVLLSVVVAIQGAYVGLTLAVQVGDAVSVRRRLLLAGAAFSLAVAIWAMHFVGMLAVRLPFSVDYLVFPTLLSLLVCVIVVGAAVYAASSGPLTPLRLTLSACLMGGGIFSMHYIGMTALHASAHMIHEQVYVTGSMAIAIAASGLALWLATGKGGRPPLLLSAATFGIAVSGMHYTAMGGVTLFPHVSAVAGAPVLSTDLLAIVVAIVAFCVSGLFLLILMPDPRRAVVDVTPRAILPASDTRAALRQALAPEAETMHPEVQTAHDGIEAPSRVFARQLPFERDGSTQFVDVNDVVAIHANAHYTFIFNGSDKLFCPLAIGDVEARLDGNRFVRVHRSHIVNIDRVIGHKRSGDSEVLEMQAAERYAVPVSRSRVVELKSKITSKLSEAHA
jgi:NO-binding membrane sensor protein with MHYT domain/DNA-binding LytR/AlgR family response regulator